MKKDFAAELAELVQKYLDDGMDIEEIINDLELKKMALEEDVDNEEDHDQ
jgi:hypothetical protein